MEERDYKAIAEVFGTPRRIAGNSLQSVLGFEIINRSKTKLYYKLAFKYLTLLSKYETVNVEEVANRIAAMEDPAVIKALKARLRKFIPRVWAPKKGPSNKYRKKPGIPMARYQKRLSGMHRKHKKKPRHTFRSRRSDV